MWFKLEASSCFNDRDMFKKYRRELSTFNVRMLNVPGSFFSDFEHNMDVSVLVELNTFEDFIRLKDSLGKSLILRKDEENLIEIYDDWRE